MKRFSVQALSGFTPLDVFQTLRTDSVVLYVSVLSEVHLDKTATAFCVFDQD